jgi:hypothetical protein
MAKFKIEVPNKNYNGVTEGVAFVDGYGETDDVNIKNVLINDYNYSLVEEKKEAKTEESKKASGDKSSKK